ncbi:MAG: diguanylate cyclase [Gammaproteobacteria bacterium]
MARSSAPAPEPSAAARAVLVVDDSRAILAVLTALIERIPGVQVVTARSLAQARAALEEDAARFFCAVVDLDLPDGPNGEIVDLVRRHPLAVIVLTGNDDAHQRERLLSGNVVDYIVKRNPAEIGYAGHLVAQLRENQSARVLVVDDSSAFRAYLVRLLETYRYRVLQAADGREAAAVLEREPDVSLVLTDVNMPVMGGAELIERIRATHAREDLAVIALSDGARPERIAALLRSGANDFIAKPFNVEEFFLRVTQNTTMVRQVRRIRQAATRDYLTGLSNRRHFYELAQPLYENARRGNALIALGMIDADHFKRINDTFGHEVGDLALKQIAQVLARTARKADVLARFGGEEFVWLGMIKQPGDMQVMFERARRAVEDGPLTIEGRGIGLSVSIGATCDATGSLEQMLARADAGVYAAKNAGRNRVCVQ